MQGTRHCGTWTVIVLGEWQHTNLPDVGCRESQPPELSDDEIHTPVFMHREPISKAWAC